MGRPNMGAQRGNAAARVAACAVLAFAVLAWAVQRPGLLTRLDARFGVWLQAHLVQAWLPWLRAVSVLHTNRVLLGGMALFALWLARWRERRAALTLLLAMASGLLLNHMLKQGFHRLRPGEVSPGAGGTDFATDFAFPSGHVAGVALFYALLVAWLARGGAPPREQARAALLGAAMVSLVAFSRLALGAHYLSDVLAAAAEGVAWAALWSVALPRR